MFCKEAGIKGGEMELKPHQSNCLDMLDVYLAELKKQFLLKGDAAISNDAGELSNSISASPIILIGE